MKTQNNRATLKGSYLSEINSSSSGRGIEAMRSSHQRIFSLFCAHKVALLYSDYCTTTLALPHRNAAVHLFLSRTRLAMLLSRSQPDILTKKSISRYPAGRPLSILCHLLAALQIALPKKSSELLLPGTQSSDADGERKNPDSADQKNALRWMSCSRQLASNRALIQRTSFASLSALWTAALCQALVEETIKPQFTRACADFGRFLSISRLHLCCVPQNFSF